VNLQRYSAIEWQTVSEDVHMTVFGEIRPQEMNRIDFALVVWHVIPLGYVTCREFDYETVYMGYGGCLQRNSLQNVRGYQMVLNELSIYKRAVTLVENTNIAMLRLAMSQGFLITGFRNHKNTNLIELTLEF
jgi:hypothetical protein